MTPISLYRPVPYPLMLSIAHCRQAGHLGSREGSSDRLGELVCMGIHSGWESWRAKQTGVTAHGCPDQALEMNNTFSKQTRRPDVEVAGDTALGTDTPFSQRVCTGCIPNTLSSWVHPHPEKRRQQKLLSWSWWSSKSKTRKELILFEH